MPWIDYEWAVVRWVSRVHRGERLNVGVVVHARTTRFLEAHMQPPWALIAALDSTLERSALERHLDAYQRVAAGDESAGPVALMPPSERFHWLTAPRSAIIQTSRVHGGRTQAPEHALARLVREQCHAVDKRSCGSER